MMTLSELLRTFINHRLDISPLTVEQYQITVRHVHKWRGMVVPLKEVNADFIRDFMRWRRDCGIAPRTVNLNRQNLLTLLHFAYEEGLTKALPPTSRQLRKLKVTKRAPEAWTIPEMKKILHGCHNSIPLIGWDHRHWTALVLVIYYTSHRLRCLLSVDRERDLRDNFLMVRYTKQGRETVHELPTDVLDVIDTLPPHESGLLFPWPYTIRQMRYRYRQILRSVGLPATRNDMFQKLRRSAATHFMAVAGEAAASELLGHSSPDLGRKHYFDPRFIPRASAAEMLPKLI